MARTPEVLLAAFRGSRLAGDAIRKRVVEIFECSGKLAGEVILMQSEK